MKNTILLVCFAFSLLSCNFNTQYLNRDKDKKDAEIVINKFFSLIKTKNYNETVSLFGKKFFAVSSKEKLFGLYSAVFEKLGELKETKVVSWETKIIEGSNPSASYVLVYKNKYDKFESQETLTLTREGNGQIKIIGYNINSDGFLSLK